MNGAEVLVPVTLFVSSAMLIFGVVYLRTRQNLAMIEKNMNPKEFANRPAPYKNLKWALLLIGAGVGLLLAYILDVYVLNPFTREIIDGRMHRYRDHDAAAFIYFSLIAIGGGVGLFGSYRIEKKWWDENNRREQTRDIV